MHRALFLLVAWGAVTLPAPWVGGHWGGPASGGPPSGLRFAETTHDFGTVIEGDDPSHVFRCRNTSATAIRLLRAHGSCGCVAAVLEPETLIQPGAAASVRVVLHTDAKVGSQRAHVRLWTDEGVDPIELRMDGRVERVVSVEPRAVYAELAAGEERSVRVRVEFLRPVAGTSAGTVGSLLRVEPDWEEGQLHLRIRAPAAPGTFQDEVDVGFDLGAERRRLGIPVRITVRREGKS
jgi:hypothetical protein